MNLQSPACHARARAGTGSVQEGTDVTIAHTALAVAPLHGPAVSPLSPTSLLRAFGTLGLFAVMFAETGLLIGFFLPGDTLLFTAGLLTATSATSRLHLPLGWVLAAAASGALCGAQAGYLLRPGAGAPRAFGAARRRGEWQGGGCGPMPPALPFVSAPRPPPRAAAAAMPGAGGPPPGGLDQRWRRDVSGFARHTSWLHAIMSG